MPPKNGQARFKQGAEWIAGFFGHHMPFGPPLAQYRPCHGPRSRCLKLLPDYGWNSRTSQRNLPSERVLRRATFQY